MKRMVSLLLVAALGAALFGCASGPQKHSASWFDYFDTVSELVAYIDTDTDFRALRDAAEERLAYYHRQYDIYHTYDGVNNLCTVNAAGGETVAVDAAVLDLLEYAVDIARLTDGYTDISLGAVLSLWHTARETGILPGKEALSAAAAHTGIDGIVIDRAAGTVRLTDPDLRLDVGALAKGYAVEQTARALAAAGYDHFALDVGGNVRTVGTLPDGSAWTVGIQNPDPDGDYLRRVSLTDGALVTSGSYQRYFEVDGVRYHHIIDKDTLFPARGFTSVSVVAGDSGLADGLSTALFCMPLEKGRALVASLDGVEALWLTEEGECVWSEDVSPTTTAPMVTTTVTTTAPTETTTAITTTEATVMTTTTATTTATTVKTTTAVPAKSELTVDGCCFREVEPGTYAFVRYEGTADEIWLPADVGDAGCIRYQLYHEVLGDDIVTVHLPAPGKAVIDIGHALPANFPATSSFTTVWLPEGAERYEWGDYRTAEGSYRPELFYSYNGFRTDQHLYLPAALPLDLSWLKQKSYKCEEIADTLVFRFHATNMIPEHIFTIHRY